MKAKPKTKPKRKIRDGYTDYWAIETAAGRIGLVACLGCGATVIVGDCDQDWADVHDNWHLLRGIPR